MKKFMLLYLSPVSAEEQMKMGGPEEGRRMMNDWMAWFQEAGNAVVDGGSPLGSDTHIAKNGSTPTHNGDYTGGYSIVQAENMDAVKAMLADHPHFMQEGNTIEVLEMLPMPGIWSFPQIGLP